MGIKINWKGMICSHDLKNSKVLSLTRNSICGFWDASYLREFEGQWSPQLELEYKLN